MQDKKLPKAVLFDLDDTIIAFDSVSLPVWEEISLIYSSLLGVSKEELLGAVLDASRWYWGDVQRHRIGRNNQREARREIVKTGLRKLGLEESENWNALADAYSQKRLEAVHLFPGSIETLQHFRGQGVKLVLVTNGEAPLQREKIERFGLSPYFDGIFIEGEVGYGKPEERFYSLALESVSAGPEECWIVGDNLEWEVEVPGKMGFYTVWNDIRGKGLPAGSSVFPHRIVRSIRELIDF